MCKTGSRTSALVLSQALQSPQICKQILSVSLYEQATDRMRTTAGNPRTSMHVQLAGHTLSWASFGVLKYLKTKMNTNRLSTDKLCSTRYPAKYCSAKGPPRRPQMPSPNSTAAPTHSATVSPFAAGSDTCTKRPGHVPSGSSIGHPVVCSPCHDIYGGRTIRCAQWPQLPKAVLCWSLEAAPQTQVIWTASQAMLRPAPL